MSEVKYVEGGDNSVLKSALYDAYKGKCWWCGLPIAYWVAQIDHLLPKTASEERIAQLADELGQDLPFDVHDPRNLGLICSGCNQEKASTDYTKTDRILNKLRQAAKLRRKVIRLVESFPDSGALASALLRAKEADLSDPGAKRTLEEHAPGFIQALANIEGFQIDWTEYRSIAVGSDGQQPLEVVLSIDGAGRRALTVLEDVCGGDLAELLLEPVVAIEEQIHADVMNMFEHMEVHGGSTYPGPPASNFLDIEVRSISSTRQGALLDLSFKGAFEAQLSASLLQDDKEPGTLEEVQGEGFVAGTFNFNVEWDLGDDGDAVLSEPGIEYEESSVWTD